MNRSCDDTELLRVAFDNEDFLPDPTGYGQSACKIAGMRKALKLLLDV